LEISDMAETSADPYAARGLGGRATKYKASNFLGGGDLDAAGNVGAYDPNKNRTLTPTSPLAAVVAAPPASSGAGGTGGGGGGIGGLPPIDIGGDPAGDPGPATEETEEASNQDRIDDPAASDPTKFAVKEENSDATWRETAGNFVGGLAGAPFGPAVSGAFSKAAGMFGAKLDKEANQQRAAEEATARDRLERTVNQETTVPGPRAPVDRQEMGSPGETDTPGPQNDPTDPDSPAYKDQDMVTEFDPGPVTEAPAQQTASAEYSDTFDADAAYTGPAAGEQESNDAASGGSGGGGSGGGDCVVCTTLHDHRLVEPVTFQAIKAYGKLVNDNTMRGYHAWGKPLASLIDRSPIARRIIAPLAGPVVRELAHRGGMGKSNWVGRQLLRFGIIASSAVSVLIKPNKGKSCANCQCHLGSKYTTISSPSGTGGKKTECSRRPSKAA